MKVFKGKIFASTEQYVSTYVWNSGQQFFVNTINFNLFNSLKTNSGWDNSEKIQIPFCIILRNKKHHTEVQARRFELNGNTEGFEKLTIAPSMNERVIYWNTPDVREMIQLSPYLNPWQHSGRRDTKIQIRDHLRRWSPVRVSKLLFWGIIHFYHCGPRFYVHNPQSFLGPQGLGNIVGCEYSTWLTHVNNHFHGGEGGTDVVGMWGTDGDWNKTCEESFGTN